MIDKFKNHKRWFRSPWMIIAAIILVPLFIFIAGFVIMLLWNWIMPAVFGLGEITFWMALGILLLSRILFGSFHHDKNRTMKRRFVDVHHKGPGYSEWWEKEGKNNYEKFKQEKSSDEKAGE